MNENKIRETVYRIIGDAVYKIPESLSDDDILYDFEDWDSLTFKEVIARLENTLEVELDADSDKLQNAQTIGELISAVCEELNY